MNVETEPEPVAWGELAALRDLDAPEGLLSAIEAIAHELQTSRQTQFQLQRDHELFLGVFEGTTDAIFVKDLGGRYLMLNSAGARMYGKPVTELLGHADAELFPPGVAERMRRADRKTMTLAVTRTFEAAVVLRPDPLGKRLFLVTQGPYRDHEGHVIGVFGIARDITGHRPAPPPLSAVVQDLEESVRARDNLLAVASHELKTPLVALRLHLENTRRQMGRHAPGEAPLAWLAARLEQGEKQVQALTRQVAELMDVTLAQAGRLSLNPEPMDFAALVHEVLGRFADTLAETGASLVIRLPPSLFLTGDPLRLERVVSNLVSNAMKYGRGEPIEVTLERRAGHARLTVRDRGLGIPPQHRHRIFERFERAAPDRKIPGTGLGLWILREIVEAHGGRVRVHGQVGGGSCFSVLLPLGFDQLSP